MKPRPDEIRASVEAFASHAMEEGWAYTAENRSTCHSEIERARRAVCAALQELKLLVEKELSR